MDLANEEVRPVKEEVEVKEKVFIINNKTENFPIQLQRIRPINLEVPVNNISSLDAKPQPSTLRAGLAKEVCHKGPPAQPFFKQDPYDLAPRGCFSPPPPPAEWVKCCLLPGGHASATPRLRFCPYQARR